MKGGIGRVLAALSLAAGAGGGTPLAGWTVRQPWRRAKSSAQVFAAERRRPRPRWVAGRYVMIDDYRFAMLASLPRRKRRHWLAHNRNKAPRVSP